jgi:hypothetical protein
MKRSKKKYILASQKTCSDKTENGLKLDDRMLQKIWAARLLEGVPANLFGYNPSKMTEKRFLRLTG